MRRTLVVLSFTLASLVIPSNPASAKSDCISKSEINKIVKTGPTREATERLLGWEGKYEGRRFSSYRRCGYSWNERVVVLGYVKNRVWFVTSIDYEDS